MAAALPADEDYRVEHYLARAEQRGDCLCIGPGNYYPTWKRPDLRRSERLAQLVCRVTRGKRPHRRSVVMHSCDNKACIRPEHLRWGTYKENNNDAWNKGRASKPPLVNHHARLRNGEHHTAKLTAQKVAAIRDRLAAGERQATIAANFGVSFQAISKIKLSQRWGWCR